MTSFLIEQKLKADEENHFVDRFDLPTAITESSRFAFALFDWGFLN